MTNRAIIVFLKTPIPGRVKTRIGNVLGHKEAVSIYNHLLQKAFETLSSVDAIKLRYYSPEIFEEPSWPSQDTQDFLQSGSDLGERMAGAFRSSLDQFKKVLIVGTDCPSLRPDIFEEAFDALDDNDIVIGPSEDGGYYLLGMSQLYPSLFQDVAWSTDQVLPTTLAIASRLKLKVHQLERLNDVDHVEDWEEYLGGV